jgi:hypothetical protein
MLRQGRPWFSVARGCAVLRKHELTVMGSAGDTYLSVFFAFAVLPTLNCNPKEK